MSQPPPKVLLVINSLEGGGAERVFASLAQALAARGAENTVDVALLDEAEQRHHIEGPISMHVLGAGGGLGASITRLRTLIRERRPDVLLSFLARANCASVVAARGCGLPVLISERVNPTSHFPKQAGRRALLRLLYPRANRVIAVSHGVADDLRRRFGVPAGRLQVIPNPVDMAGVRAAARAPSPIPLPERFYVGVGRLVPNKNWKLLLQAFAASGGDEHLVVLGEGEQRPALQAMVHALGLAARVHMPGYLANPYAVMARVQAYVSASNAEGFPNSLLEALALGLPAAVTDCPSGPAEILADTLRLGARGVVEAPYGLLTPVSDGEALADALRRLRLEALRARYAHLGPLRAAAFRPDAVYGRYAAALSDAAPHMRFALA